MPTVSFWFYIYIWPSITPLIIIYPICRFIFSFFCLVISIVPQLYGLEKGRKKLLKIQDHRMKHNILQIRKEVEQLDVCDLPLIKSLNAGKKKLGLPTFHPKRLMHGVKHMLSLSCFDHVFRKPLYSYPLLCTLLPCLHIRLSCSMMYRISVFFFFFNSLH